MRPVVALLVLGLATPASARAEEAQPLPDAQAVEALRAEVAGRIEALRGRDDSELPLLEALDRAYVQQLEELSRARQLEAETAEARGLLESAPREQLESDPPYSLPVLDSWSERGADLALRAEKLARAEEDAQAAVRAVQERHEADERARRLAAEELARASGAERAAQQQRVDLLTLRGQLSRAQWAWRRQALQNARSALALLELRAEAAAAVVAWVRQHLRAKPSDLDAALAALEKREFALERQRDAARLDVAAAEERFARVQRRAGAVAEPDAALAAELAARRIEVTVQQQKAALLAEQLERVQAAREAWSRRYAALAGKPGRDELDAWHDETRHWLEGAERDQRLRSARLAELRADLDRSREELTDAGPGARPWLEREARMLGELIALYEQDLQALAETRRLQARLLAELEPGLARFDLGAWLDHAGRGARTLWRYELVASEDNPITVGKVVTALLFFGLGWLLARLLSQSLGSRIFPRIRLEEGIAQAYQSLVFYGLIVVAFLVALRVVNIPLTAFAIAGGALAIGVGFGSQNLMNNFISGIILLAERPIKIGDLIDVEGIYGTVERIGLRSTRVQAGENYHVIVPNSAFLENRVINWTHRDRNVRISVAVGVIYGSPTEKVVELIQQALAEHPRVLKKPEPIVLFTNFGDNSLDFEAHFWITIRNVMERRRTESDLRFRIDQLFREHGLVIAFPQRDVHLDAAQPLPVRLVRDAEPEDPR